jgi:SAM-dependent methyltransferase
MTKTFLGDLLNESRLLKVLYDNLPNEIKTEELYNFVELYLAKYAQFNNISAANAIDIYTNFITTFNKHCKQFEKSGRYPAENGQLSADVSREEYDIVLLLSVLFTPHRFRIMQILHQQKSAGNALFIGLGPGLEVSLTKENLTEIHAYDLSVNKFLFAEFSDFKINCELYTGQKQDYFDAIYLIELLEHLPDPFLLLEICCTSLKKGGKVFLTTATAIPQFDHLYNFPRDHKNFESQIKNMGFSIAYKEMILHNYLAMEIKPCNHFYVLEKNKIKIY